MKTAVWALCRHIAWPLVILLMVGRRRLRYGLTTGFCLETFA